MTGIDATHDPAFRCWVPGTDEHADFPIQNLPLGVFSPPGGGPRCGVAVGGHILDLSRLPEAGVGEATTLNMLLGSGAAARVQIRAMLSAMLSDKAQRTRVEPMLYPAAACTMHLPCAIGDYTDFYVGIHHANNIGRQFRPDNPLLPNYKHIPIGYHGRASSVQPSGTPLLRPNGQTKAPDATGPSFGPCQRLDYELELGVWIGSGNSLGEPIRIGQAAASIAGFCLLNDWSARDVQGWEYQPLGPFLSKNFGSTISPWVITPEALAPFRVPQPPRPQGDPAPLPYLMDACDQDRGALAVELEVLIATAKMRKDGLPPHRLSASNAQHMYWTAAQMITHHTCGGCNLRSGDLLGTGTISGPNRASCGSILEATLGGKEPARLETGEERRFLEDGDEILMRATARRDGFATIGFGECRAVIRPALDYV